MAMGRFRRFLSCITVEPAVFIFMLCTYYYGPIQNSIYMYKVCQSVYHLNHSTCMDIADSKISKNLSSEGFLVSKTASSWLVFATIVAVGPSIFVTLALARSTSSRGRRFFLLLPFLGAMLGSSFDLLIYTRQNVHISFLLLGSAVYGITGNMVAVMAFAFSYVARHAVESSRTVRIVMLEITVGAATALGSYTVVPLMRQTYTPNMTFAPVDGYIASIFTIIMLQGMAMLYLIVRFQSTADYFPHNMELPDAQIWYSSLEGRSSLVRSVEVSTSSANLLDNKAVAGAEADPNSATQDSQAPLGVSNPRPAGNLEPIAHSPRCSCTSSCLAFVSWPLDILCNHASRLFLTVFVASCLAWLPTQGRYNLLYLYTQRIGYDMKDYGVYFGFGATVQTVASALFVFFVKKHLKWYDASVALWGLGSAALGFIVLGCSGFRLTGWAFDGYWWSSVLFGMFSLVGPSSLKSLASDLVAHAEQTKLFTLIAVADGVVAVVAAVIYNYFIWWNTAELLPSIGFFISAGFLISSATLTVWVYLKVRRSTYYREFSEHEAFQQFNYPRVDRPASVVDEHLDQDAAAASANYEST